MEQTPYIESPAAGLARTYVCGDCNQVTRNPRLYLQHRRDYHRDPITIHECDLCVYASKHSQKLMRHRRTVHRSQLKPLELCPIVMADRTVTAAELSPLSADSPLNLSVSSSASDTISPNVRSSPCKWCSMQAFNKATLIEHIRQAHPHVDILKCKDCNYCHFDRDKFNRHERYHTLNYIQCKICDFRTIYKWNLERHMKHHVDTVPMSAASAFQCGKCNFTASTKQSITAHEIGHHDKDDKVALMRDDVPPKMETGDPDKPFDVTEFLELVWGDGAKRGYLELRSELKAETMVEKEMERNAEEAKMENDNTESGKTEEIQPAKYLICCNCSHRNEIPMEKTNPSGNLAVKPVSPRPPALMTIYRCGFCYQTSNWKHVIERHCRLLHNSMVFIERYNNDDKIFQSIEAVSPKRKRLESLPNEDYTPKVKRPYTFTSMEHK